MRRALCDSEQARQDAPLRLFLHHFAVPCNRSLSLPPGEVSEHSEDGEGEQRPYTKVRKALSVSFADSSPSVSAKTRSARYAGKK